MFFVNCNGTPSWEEYKPVFSIFTSTMLISLCTANNLFHVTSWELAAARTEERTVRHLDVLSSDSAHVRWSARDSWVLSKVVTVLHCVIIRRFRFLYRCYDQPVGKILKIPCLVDCSPEFWTNDRLSQAVNPFTQHLTLRHCAYFSITWTSCKARYKVKMKTTERHIKVLFSKKA